MSKKAKPPYPVELRVCIKCGEEKEIVQRYIKTKTNICKDCTNLASKVYARKRAIEEGKRIGVKGRVPYPGGFEETARAKLLNRKKELDKIKEREDWLVILRKRLDDIMNDEDLMSYINHRGKSADENENRKHREDKDDTRYLTWEQYERDGWGLEEDD